MNPSTTEARTREAVLNTLGELGGQLTKAEEVEYQGTQFVLPGSYRGNVLNAAKFLMDLHESEEREMQFSRSFTYRPWDGANATQEAFRELFGASTPQATWGMFGKTPPQLMTINVGPGETMQVPWGDMTVPGLDGLTFTLGGTTDPEYGSVFQLSAVGPRKWRHHVEGVFRAVEEKLISNSIYRGKAFDGKQMPDFLDLSTVDPSQVVYSDNVRRQLDANVWSLIRHTEATEKAGLPLKRAALLAGPYGTGKTLAAYLTALECQENGWTFVYCRPNRDDLYEVMQTARMYQPSVVFFEDLEVMAGAQERDHISQLLDVFDGIQSKDAKIMAILTTNHADKIHKGMLRPGRLDAVIEIEKLDAAGIQQLVENVVPSAALAEDLKHTHKDFEKGWAEITSAMDDFLPAFVREAGERAVRYSLARNGGKLTTVSKADLIDSATGLRSQFELMDGAREVQERPRLETAMAALVSEAVVDLKLETIHGDPMGKVVAAD